MYKISEASTAEDRRIEIRGKSTSATCWLSIILLVIVVIALFWFLPLPWYLLSYDGEHSKNELTVPISSKNNVVQKCPSEQTTERPIASMLETSDMNEYRNKRIKVLIFIQVKFNGYIIDQINLNEALPKIGISPSDIDVYTGSTSAEIQQILNTQSKNISSDYDSLMIFMDSTSEFESLWEPFTADKCKQLKGKPKIFFIQASRGDKIQAGVKMYKRGKRFAEDETSTHTIPVQADMLQIYGTVPDHVAYSNGRLGSWYIHALSKEIESLPSNTKFNIFALLTKVNRRLAVEYTDNPDGKESPDKQCATFTSTLTQSLYFTTRSEP